MSLKKKRRHYPSSYQFGRLCLTNICFLCLIKPIEAEASNWLLDYFLHVDNVRVCLSVCERYIEGERGESHSLCVVCVLCVWLCVCMFECVFECV